MGWVGVRLTHPIFLKVGNVTIGLFRLLAIISMIADHAGGLFFPSLEVLKILGRFAYPAFSLLISSGLENTRDRIAYLDRLFLLGCISQPFYILLFPGHMNDVFFLFASGLLILCFESGDFFCLAGLLLLFAGPQLWALLVAAIFYFSPWSFRLKRGGMNFGVGFNYLFYPVHFVVLVFIYDILG